MTNIKELIEEAREITGWNRLDNVWGENDSLLDNLADALEEIEDIVLGLDYSSDHDRIQALTLLFPDA